MTRPKFVKLDQLNNWFPEHDVLYSSTGKLLDGNNAYLFWQCNCKVRAAFSKLSGMISNGQNIRVTRTLLKDTAGVQNAGLYNHRRRGWVMAGIANLNKLRVDTYKRKAKEELTINNRLNDLKLQLKTSLNQVATLTKENTVFKHEIEKYKSLVRTQERQIQRLKSLIEEKLSN